MASPLPSGAEPGGDLEQAVVAFLREHEPRARMRSLLRKDLLILGARACCSPARHIPDRDSAPDRVCDLPQPSKPRVAIVDETPPGQTVRVGSQRVSVSQYAQEIFKQVDAVPVGSREEAIEQIKSGQSSPPS